MHTTHMIPVELARPLAVRTAHQQLIAHAVHTGEAPQLPTRRRTVVRLAIAALIAAAALLLLTQHYGTHATLNEGYTLGTANDYVGFETRGDVGPFATINTAVGNVWMGDGQMGFCPAGATDEDCGA